ncbi:MAG: hypothetical protein IPK70_12420 [Flavobacteriales bacterium]|jgi:hypothetical protein|nr:hypothetical protein [Flavobacteriales bacterium]
MFATLIGNTLLRMFDLYRAFPRRLLELGLFLMMASLAFGFVAGGTVSWLAWELQLIPEAYASDFQFSMFFGMFSEQQGTVWSFMVLALGLAAVRLWREGEGGFGELSFTQLWAGIRHRNWSVFGVCCIALVLIKVALYNPVFDISGLRDPFWEGLGEDMGPRKYRFMKWLNDLIAEFFAWAPDAMVVALLYAEAGKRFIRSQWREAFTVLMAMALLTCILNAVQLSLLSTLKLLVFPAFSIPFEASLIPLVMQGGLIVLLGGLLMPAQLLCYTVPFEQWAGKGPKPAPDPFDEAASTAEG